MKPTFPPPKENKEVNFLGILKDRHGTQYDLWISKDERVFYFKCEEGLSSLFTLSQLMTWVDRKEIWATEALALFKNNNDPSISPNAMMI